MSPSVSRRRGLVWVALAVGVALTALYGASYGVARGEHHLVRYESGCIARGNLEARAQDIWDWPYRCSELRLYLNRATQSAPDDRAGTSTRRPSDPWERTYAPLMSIEEIARNPGLNRPSICSIPSAVEAPGNKITRPTWCEIE